MFYVLFPCLLLTVTLFPAAGNQGFGSSAASSASGGHDILRVCNDDPRYTLYASFAVGKPEGAQKVAIVPGATKTFPWNDNACFDYLYYLSPSVPYGDPYSPFSADMKNGCVSCAVGRMAYLLKATQSVQVNVPKTQDAKK